MSQKPSQISNEEGNGVIWSLICGQVVVPAVINQTTGNYQLLWIAPLLFSDVFRVSHGSCGPRTGPEVGVRQLKESVSHFNTRKPT